MKRIIYPFLISICLLSSQFTTYSGDCSLQAVLPCLSYIKNQLTILSSVVIDDFINLSLNEQLHFISLNEQIATCCDTLHSQIERLESILDENDNITLLSATNVISSQISNLTIDELEHFSVINSNLATCCTSLESQLSALIQSINTSIIDLINTTITQTTYISALDTLHFSIIENNLATCCEILNSQISQIDNDLTICCNSINTQLADLLTLDLSLNAQLGNLLGLNLNLGSQLLDIQDLQLTLNGDIAGLNLANVTLNAQLLNLLDNDLTLNAQLAGINLANITLSSVLQNLELNNLSVNAQLGSILQSNLGLSAQLGVVTSLLDLLII